MLTFNIETIRVDHEYFSRKAIKSLDIIAVGAGIARLTAGLALARTGHRVTILESVPNLVEAGAGIQIAPNASRILHGLGVLEEVMEHASVFTNVSIRKSGCRILTSHAVTAVDPTFLPRAKVENGGTGETIWFQGDVLIAADGIRSTVRSQMVIAGGHEDRPVPTGDAAYRLLIPKEKIKQDKVLLEMMEKDVAVRYMGPGKHVMTYPLRHNTLYNLVLLHPTGAKKPLGDTQDSWTTKGDRREMIDMYKEWSPAVRAWLEHADNEVLEWDLYTHPALPTWVQGSVALIGDACHPMLPYVAQGAANAMEDAAVLAAAFTCTSDVQLALGVYERVRKDRAEKIAASAAATREVLHLHDGPGQIKRDEAIRNASRKSGDHPDKWGNQKWQDYMWGIDVVKDTIEKWDQPVSGSGDSARVAWSVSRVQDKSYGLYVMIKYIAFAVCWWGAIHQVKWWFSPALRDL
ncbi:hypothetical protein DL769_006947 [Monosporascus sp. CRB-8-3]|nr:hypothetical protein DL769_006947 [Monosporascus sp. CRB-8-3]